MECDMKAVSIGTKRKAEVLETCLQQMKTCFSDVSQNKNSESTAAFHDFLVIRHFKIHPKQYNSISIQE